MSHQDEEKRVREALQGAYPDLSWQSAAPTNREAYSNAALKQADPPLVEVDLGEYQIVEVGEDGGVDHVRSPEGFLPESLFPTTARIRVQRTWEGLERFCARLEILDLQGRVVETRSGYADDPVLAVKALESSGGRGLPVWLPVPGVGLDWITGISSLIQTEHEMDPAAAREDYPEQVEAGEPVKVKAVMVYTMRRALTGALSIISETIGDGPLYSSPPRDESSEFAEEFRDMIVGVLSGFDSDNTTPYDQLTNYRAAVHAVKTLVLPQLVAGSKIPPVLDGPLSAVLDAGIWCLDWLISNSKDYVINKFVSLADALAFGVPESIVVTAYEPTVTDPQPDDSATVKVPWSLIENFNAARDRLKHGGGEDFEKAAPQTADAHESTLIALATLTMSYELAAEVKPIVQYVANFYKGTIAPAAPFDPPAASEDPSTPSV